jgi:hypothetical protein
MTLSQDAALGKNCAQNVPHGDGLVQDFHLFPRNINKIITLFYEKNKIFTVFSQKHQTFLQLLTLYNQTLKRFLQK